MKNYNITEKLTEYLEFDVKLIINETNDYATIFGGAIRDIIAKKEIHDIDILCLTKSEERIQKVLSKEGYVYNDDIVMKSIYSMYQGIHCILEPHTWIKKDKIVQLIRPALSKSSCNDNVNKLLSQIDISCCGVSYSYDGLKENVPNAIKHCEHKIFYQLKDTIMHNYDRFVQRVYKLENRGWKFSEYMEKEDLKKIEKMILRENKIERILNVK